MEIQIAVAKTNRHFLPESGDTLELVERPNGGVSVVLADGQNSGREAKLISSMVVRKVISLLAEGVRDGAAARAASDYLYTERNGQALAYLTILSADLQTGTLVITRNNPTPVFFAVQEKIETLAGESVPVGGSRNTRPAISEVQLESGMTVVFYTDGLSNAGLKDGLQLDACTLLEAMLEEQEPSAQEIADTLLAEAIRLDHDAPDDDMSVVVLRVQASQSDQIRRMTVRVPVWNLTSL